jgi:hypothetical protein
MGQQGEPLRIDDLNISDRFSTETGQNGSGSFLYYGFGSHLFLQDG